MTLKLSLKSGESVFVGRTRLTIEADATCVVYVNGDAPILRANEMVDAAKATDSLGRFRYVLQEMYLSNDVGALVTDYVEAVSRLLSEHPELGRNVLEANEKLRLGKLYEAVRIGKRMSSRNPS